ncbi:unnamed protein product [Closterium sp. NIES-65]|nr:unnamed protein product [Closterium sp. NIES-65]
MSCFWTTSLAPSSLLPPPHSPPSTFTVLPVALSPTSLPPSPPFSIPPHSIPSFPRAILTKILRHQASQLGLHVAPDGFVRVADLSAAAPQHQRPPPPRLPTRWRTCALTVVHGTYERHLPSILASGLSRMNRQHVHLTKGVPSQHHSVVSGFRSNAEVAGGGGRRSRHGRWVAHGMPFFESDNGVILTSGFPRLHPSNLLRLHPQVALAPPPPPLPSSSPTPPILLYPPLLLSPPLLPLLSVRGKQQGRV